MIDVNVMRDAARRHAEARLAEAVEAADERLDKARRKGEERLAKAMRVAEMRLSKARERLERRAAGTAEGPGSGERGKRESEKGQSFEQSFEEWVSDTRQRLGEKIAGAPVGRGERKSERRSFDAKQALASQFQQAREILTSQFEAARQQMAARFTSARSAEPAPQEAPKAEPQGPDGGRQFGRRRNQFDHPRRGGIIAWLLLSILMIFGVVILGGIFFARSIRVHETRNDVQVETPFGSVHVRHDGKTSPGAAGMPVYPGAKPRGNGESASVDLSGLFGDNDLHIVAGKWETGDPPDKVQKYYEDKFPSMSVVQHNGQIEMHGVDGHGKRVIVLRRLARNDGDGTEISLASVGEPKAN